MSQPYSQGYAEVHAEIYNGEKFRTVRVLVDTRADGSSVSDEWARVLRLPTEPTQEKTYTGILGRITSNTCSNFTMKVGGRDIDVHATVIPRLTVGLLVGMNTLQKYQMDVLLSKRVLKIVELEVPLVHRHDPDTITKAEAARKYHKLIDIVEILAITTIVVVAVAIGLDYFSYESILTRRMKAGEKLSREDFLYVLEIIDREEERDWSEYVTEDVWKEARWEAYQRKLDVDVVLGEQLDCKVVTRGLYRWEEEVDNAKTTRPQSTIELLTGRNWRRNLASWQRSQKKGD